jgi:hypothetical protein
MRMKRDQRFPVVMTRAERTLLNRLALQEHISGAAVIRRLIWREAEERGLLPPTGQQARGQGAHQEAVQGM